jgi:S-DNA-T family DNA segregation ATPase FtsK/SpoIIIE
MLFQAPDAPAPVRLQGVYVSDSELQRLVRYWRDSSGQTPYTNVTPASSGTHLSLEARLPGVPLKQIPLWEERDTEEQGDVLLDEAIDLVRRQGRASVSMLQRRMRIGYTRAARLIEAMEAKGIVGSPAPGTGTREVLDYGPAAPPADES